MVDLKEMLKAGVHFGHKTSRWSPAMNPYIWGSKNKIHLIDVSKTAFLLERTGKYLQELAKNGGSFLWIGTKKPAQEIIKKTAINLKMPFVVHRWIGGTLSNFDQIKKAITKLLYLKEAVNKSTRHYKKKEISMIQKEVARLEKNIGGILDLTYPPAAVIVVDAKKEHSAIREATSLKIPTVALVDTNTDPDGINFVIPANDDSPRSINFVIEYLAAQIAEGKKEYDSKKKEAKAITQKTKTESNSQKQVDKESDDKVSAKKVISKSTTVKEIKAKKPEPKVTAKPTHEEKKDSVKNTKEVTKTEDKKVSTKK
ncbi:MAG: 30S ribosomal protein S2 [bacterium]